MFAYDNPANAAAAVTGGLIVRDATLPAAIQGRDLFADFYAGQLVDFVPTSLITRPTIHRSSGSRRSRDPWHSVRAWTGRSTWFHSTTAGSTDWR